MRKKLVALLLSLAMILTMMPAMGLTAFAEGDSYNFVDAEKTQTNYCVAVGNSQALSVALKAGVTNVAYKWYEEGAVISGETGQSFTVTTNASDKGKAKNYKCEVTDGNNTDIVEFIVEVNSDGAGTEGSPFLMIKNDTDKYFHGSYTGEIDTSETMYYKLSATEFSEETLPVYITVKSNMDVTDVKMMEEGGEEDLIESYNGPLKKKNPKLIHTYQRINLTVGTDYVLAITFDGDASTQGNVSVFVDYDSIIDESDNFQACKVDDKASLVLKKLDGVTTSIDSYQWYVRKQYKYEDASGEREYDKDDIESSKYIVINEFEYWEKIDNCTSSKYDAPAKKGQVSEVYACLTEYKKNGRAVTELSEFDIKVISDGEGTLLKPFNIYSCDDTNSLYVGAALDTGDGTNSYYTSEEQEEGDNILICYRFAPSTDDDKSSEYWNWTPVLSAQAERNIVTIELYKESDLKGVSKLEDRDKSKNIVKNYPLYKVESNDLARGSTSTAKYFKFDKLDADDCYIIVVKVSKNYINSDGEGFRLTVFDADPCWAFGHVWHEGTITKNPTDTEPGEVTYKCLNCREEQTVEFGKLDDLNNAKEALSNPTGNTREEIITNLQDLNTNTLEYYLTEGAPEKTKSQLKEIEKEVGGAYVNNNSELSDVSIVGGGLNALVSSEGGDADEKTAPTSLSSIDNTVELRVTESSNKDTIEDILKTNASIINKKKYMTVVSMNLYDSGEIVQDPNDIFAQLNVPVVISFDVPDGINPNKLIVIHKRERAMDNANEIIYPTLSADKKTASIVVSHFSDFLIAEATVANNDNTATAKSTKASGTNTGDSNDLLPYFMIFDLMLLAIAGWLYAKYREQNR